MPGSAKTTGKVLVTVLLGVFSFPMLGYGTYLFTCWIRVHTSSLYYVDYPYLSVSLVWLSIGLANAWVTFYGVWRRSFHGFFCAVPVIVGLLVAEIIPNHGPRVSSLGADVSYLSGIHPSLDAWYASNHRFPSSEAEFKEAFPSAPVSQYEQNGDRLPYEFVVATGADGPRTANTSPRPAVIYYCVSTDQREFWVTMTRLQSDVAATAHVEIDPGLPREFWVYHGVGRDRHIKNP
jgi:hypothetical protein